MLPQTDPQLQRSNFPLANEWGSNERRTKMTEGKFDGTIGRCASVVAIVQLIMFIVKNAKGDVALSEFLWCIAEVFVAVFALFLVFCFFSHRRKGKLDSAAKRATLVDYKYCSDISATGIDQLLRDRYEIDIENLSGSVVILKDRPNYLSSEKFFENESIMSDFECVPLKNEDKKNKCILQVLYIPIDKDENVPVILRMPDQHSTASVDNPRFTFISFSPVPRRYGAQFDKLDCYKREVPSDYELIDIDEYGTALSKQGSIYYLFYIFFARYNCQFLKDGL